MPGDLLLELESPPAAVNVAALEGQEAALKELLANYLDGVAAAVAGMRGWARPIETAWQGIVLVVGNGHAEEMHAARQRFFNAVAHRLDIVRRTYDLAVSLRRQYGEARIPDPAVLSEEIAALEEFIAKVFDRWHSVEDLEALAVQFYPLSGADLKALAKRLPAPDVWRYEAEANLP